MRRRDLIGGLAATLLAGPAAAQRRRRAARPWTEVTAALPAGGHLLGNPAAPARLTEYLSYTCPHCADFYAQASGPLARDHVATGRLSVELMPAVRDALDLTAALLARCGGASRVFADTGAILIGQPSWMEAGDAFQRTNAARLRGLPLDRALAELADGSGLAALMRARGYPAAQVSACLADEGARTTLGRLSDRAWREIRIGGTPAFFLNGERLAAAHDWASLRPLLPR